MLNYLERLERLARSTLTSSSAPRQRHVSLDRRALRLEELDPRMLLSVTPGDTVVTFNFTIAGQQESFQVELFNNDAPQTVANFLAYVNSGEYNNTFIHRMVNGFVVQGGGYSVNDAPFSLYSPANGIDPTGNHIATNAAIPLEYSASHPNVAGTLAMARTSDPNSATSEWFFNTVDNSTSLGPGGSSTQGYAVFGQILGDGLQVIQQINALSTLDTLYAANNKDPYFVNTYANLPQADQQAVGSLADTPFTNFNPDTNQKITASNLVVLNSVVVSGGISGTVYADTNQSGSLDTGEPGLSGWTVYVDSNNNGQLDNGEVSALTAADGTYTLNGVGAGTYTVRVQPQANWSPKSPAGGSLQVTVNSSGSTTGQNFGEVLTLSVPTAPTLSSQSDSGVAGDGVTNVNKPTFNITGVHPGATVQLFDDQNGGHVLLGSAVASGTSVSIVLSQALAEGPHQIKAVQSESGFTSSESSGLGITIDTTPPQITDATPPLAVINTPYSFTASTNDPSATFALGAHPGSMAINPTTGVVNWTPTGADVGFQQFVVTATDLAGNISQHTYSVSVDGPPEFSPFLDQTVNQGSSLTITPTVADIHSPLTYSLSPNAPADAVFDPATGKLTWSPTSADAPGQYTFTFTVTDSVNLTATQSVHVTVVAPPAIGSINDVTIDEGKTLSIPLSASDQAQVSFQLVGTVPSGASASFTSASTPSGIFITSAGVFTWTPSESQGPGVYTLTLKATGAGGLTSTTSFQVTVNEVDQAPVLSPLSPVSVKQGGTVSATASAHDADLPAQTLIYSLDPGAPAGATINSQTGVISWSVPSGFATGAVTLNVRVTEAGSQGLSVSTPLVINVSENSTSTSTFNGFDLFTSSAVSLGGFASGLVVNNGVPINSGLSLSPSSSAIPGSLPTQAAALQQLAGVVLSGPVGGGLGLSFLTAHAVDFVIGFDSGIPHNTEGMEKELARSASGAGTPGNSPDTGMPSNDAERATFDQEMDVDRQRTPGRNDSSQNRQINVPAPNTAARANSFWGVPKGRYGVVQVGAVGGRIYRAPRAPQSLPPAPSEVRWYAPANDTADAARRRDTTYAAAASAMMMPLLVSQLPENRKKSRSRLGRWLEPLGQ